MICVKSYTVIFYTDTDNPGYLFADISDKAVSDPRLFFENELGHVEEYSYHSHKQVQVNDDKYVKAYLEGSPDSCEVFASLDDACLYCDREVGHPMAQANWSYKLIENDSETTIKPQYFDAFHGEKLYDFLKKEDKSMSVGDKLVVAGWVTANGMPLFGLSYYELERYVLEESSSVQENEHNVTHINLSTPKSYKSELTYLSKSGYNYCTIESITDVNIQELWQAKTMDVCELLLLFGVDYSEVDGDETIVVTSRDTTAGVEQQCYELESLIEGRDVEHGTSEIEMYFILDHHVSEYDEAELQLDNRERIHQHCEDNDDWKLWRNYLSDYYANLFSM